MTHDEARALLAEGRQHDEAMENAPWDISDISDGKRNRFAVTGRGGRNEVSADMADEDALGVVWMRTNLARLLDGYAEALEENERLRAGLTAWRADIESACTDEGWHYMNHIDEILKGEP